MIDPKLLTDEAGFVEGCVVEIIWEDYISRQPEFYVWGSSSDGSQKEYMIQQYGASVRPLTGPMAIWNFAPEWATCLMRDEHEFTFLASDEYGDGFESRPWWSK